MATAVILAFVLAKLLGGSWQQLASVRIRYALLAVLALAIQLYVRMAGFKGWPLTSGTAPYVYASSFLLLFLVLWINRKLPWFWLIALGVAMNALVIFANGGRMPVSAAALIATGSGPSAIGWAHSFSHQLLTEQTHIPWLGDVVPVNIPLLSGWWHNASPMSPGDLTETLGMFLFILGASGVKFLASPQRLQPKDQTQVKR